MAFGYYSPLLINAAQVPSTQTDFPVLVSVTDARFKTVANSGHVQNANGYDIRPYTDSTLVTAITGYELERYNATTGEVIMWVKVSSLSSSSTPFVLAYGDSGINTDGSSTTTWSNSFISVYHLKDGTTLSLTDSIGGFTLTNFNSVTATAGQIDGAASFVSASNQHLAATASNPGSAFTFSGWVNATSFPNTYNFMFGMQSASNYKGIYAKSTGKISCNILVGSGNVGYDGTGATTLSSSTPYYVTFSYDTTTGLDVYVNGSLDKNVASGSGLTSTATSYIGSEPINSTLLWNGVIDEVRFATAKRTANWTTTEYNNQSAPGTFETLGAEVSTSPILGIYTI